MKVGDLVRIKEHGPVTAAGDVWHEFMGKVGVIITEAKRLHIPAAKVIVDGQMVEFDLEELEIVGDKLSDDQLEDVVGGQSLEMFSHWRASALNERSRK